MDKKGIYSAIKISLNLGIIYFFIFTVIAVFSPSLVTKNWLYINAVLTGIFFLLIIMMFTLGFDLRKNNIVLADERDLEVIKVAGYKSSHLTMMFTLILAMATAFKIVEISAPQSLLLVLVFGATSAELLKLYYRRKGKV